MRPAQLYETGAPMLEWFAFLGSDAAAFFLSALLILIYQLYMRRRAARNPAYTVQGVNTIARTAWVENIMREGKDILAVQTLRNSTMAATFLASTAILLIIGVLTLSGQGQELGNAWHALNVGGSTHAQVWMLKLILLLLDFFIAFFSFAMSIRVYNHVGYMINVPLAARRKVISPQHVAHHLNRAGNYYSIGMRAYYYAVPLVFWLFGPLFMLAATLILIPVLYRLDRAPKILEEEYSDAAAPSVKVERQRK